MEFIKASKTFYLNKSTYVNLRWIAIIGQLITIFFGLIHGLGFASNLSENPIVQDQMFSMINSVWNPEYTNWAA